MKLFATMMWTLLGIGAGVIWLAAMAGASLCLAIAAGADRMIVGCKSRIDGAW
jgi:hypothetical protein